MRLGQGISYIYTIANDQDLDKENDGEAELKACFSGFMAENVHAEQGAECAARESGKI